MKAVGRLLRDLMVTIAVIVSAIVVLFTISGVYQDVRIAWMMPVEPSELVSAIVTGAGIGAALVVFWSVCSTGRGTPWRLRLTAISATGVVLAGGIRYLEPQTRYPIETEAEARPILVRLLKRRAFSSPGRFTTNDLGAQIRHVNISGPGVEYERPEMRFVDFEFDTGCGTTARLTAVIGAEEGDHLLGVVKRNCSLPFRR